MLPYQDKPPQIESFAEQLLKDLADAGAIDIGPSEWTPMYGPRGEYARFSFRQAGKQQAITLDLAPGVESGFGRTVEMLHSSGWRSIFGPELIGRPGAEGDVIPDIVTPHKALGGYLSAAFDTTGRIQSLINKPAQQRFGYTLYKGMEAGAGAGGLFMYGPSHSELARIEYSQRLRVGWETNFTNPDEVYRSVMNFGMEYSQTDPTNRLAQLISYGLYKEDSGALSLRRYGRGTQAITGGAYEYEAMGLGRQGQDAAKMAGEVIKRYPISYGFAGIRETGYPLVPTSEYTMERLQPSFITADKQSAGYKWLNAILPGEKTRRAAYVRPNMAFTAASPVPGQATLYGGPGMEPGMIGYTKYEDINLPNVPMQDLRNVKIATGIMRKTDLTDTAGLPIYQQVRPLEGATIAPRESAVIGTMRYEYEGKQYMEPITMRAGQTPIVLESANLFLPKQYNISTGEPIRHLYKPGTRGIASGETLAMQLGASSGIPAYATAQENPFLQIQYSQGAFPSIKGFGQKHILQELAAPFGRARTRRTVQGRVISGVSGELKEALSGFVGHFTSMTPQQQTQMLGEFANVPGATPQHTQLASAMQRYATGFYGSHPQGAIDMNVMTRIYGGVMGVPIGDTTADQMMLDLRSAVTRQGYSNTAIREYGYGAMSPDWHRWEYMSRESYQDVFRSAAWGVDMWLREQGQQSLNTPEGRAYFKQQFPGRTVGESIRTHISRFVPLEHEMETPFGQRGPMGFAEFRGASLMQNLVGGFTPEYQSQMPKFGYLERASMMMRFPELARAAGMDLLSGPRGAMGAGTGLFPEHMMGWEELGNVFRRSVKGELRTIPKNATPITPEFRQEMLDALAGVRGEDVNYKMLQDIVEGKEGYTGLPGYKEGNVLYDPETGLTMATPLAMSRISTGDYEESSPFYSPVSVLSNMYPGALEEFVTPIPSGPEGAQMKTMEHNDPTTRTLRRFYNEGVDLLSRGKGVDKLMQSVLLAGGSGGRYAGRFTAGPLATIVQQQALNNMLTGISEASLLPERERRRALAGSRETIKAYGRMGGFVQRDPTLTMEGALQPTWITPVDTLRQLGINIPQGTRFEGGKIIGGSIWETNLPFAAGYNLLASTGDWDADQGLAWINAMIGPKGTLQMIDSGELSRVLGQSPRQLMEMQEQLIARQYGTEGIVPGGAMNIFADAWSGIIGGMATGPKEPVLGRIPTKTLHQQAWGTVKAAGGMGVAYNVRRLMSASAAALRRTPEGASGIHTSGALMYQEYLDKMAGKVIERGGLREVETLLNTATWGSTREGALNLIALARPTAGRFTSFWEEGLGWDRLTTQLGSALERDISRLSQPIGMEYPARLMAMREQDVPVLQGYMEERGVMGGINLYKDYLAEEGTREYGQPMRYDPTRSILGNAMLMQATFRSKGALGKMPHMVPTGKGDMVVSMGLLGGKPVAYQGESFYLRDLAYEPRMLSAEAAYSYETRRGIITPRMIHTVAGIADEMKQQGKPVPFPFQAIIGTFGGEDVAEEYAAAAAKMGYTDKDRPYSRAIQIAQQIIQSGYRNRYGEPEIRGSSLNYIGAEFPANSTAAAEGTKYHKFMEEFLKQAKLTGEVEGIESVEGNVPARHGIGGRPDVIMNMPEGTPYAGQRVGLDLKTGKGEAISYAGQAASYIFSAQLASMGILKVPREQARQIHRDVWDLARQERSAAFSAGETPLPREHYRQEIGRRIFQTGMENLTWLGMNEAGPDVLASRLSTWAELPQSRGGLGLTLRSIIEPEDPTNISQGTTRTPIGRNRVTASINDPQFMLPAQAGGGGLRGGGDDGERTTAGTADEGDGENRGNRGGGIPFFGGGMSEDDWTRLGQIFANAQVNVAHHSYTKSNFAALRASVNAISGLRRNWGEMSIVSQRWANEFQEMLGMPVTQGGVSNVDMIQLMMDAQTQAPDQFRNWLAQNQKRIQAWNKSTVSPMQTVLGNINKPEVQNFLLAAGIPQSEIDQIVSFAQLSDANNNIAASLMGTALGADALKDPDLAPGGRKMSGRMGRLASGIGTMGLDEFAKAVDEATTKIKDLSKVVEEEGPDSVEGIRASQQLRREQGRLKSARAQMLLPSALDNYERALADARANPDDQEAMKQLLQAQADFSTTIGEYTSGQQAMRQPGLSATAMNRFARRMIGGWGLMYLGHLASFPMGQYQFGLQESQAYGQAMGQMIGGYGAGGGYTFPAIQYDLQRQAIASGGTTMAGYQRLMAQAPPGIRDITGGLMSGMAAAAGTLYVANAASGIAGLEGIAAGAMGAALPIGALVAGGALVASQAAISMQPPEMTVGTIAGGYLRGTGGGALDTLQQMWTTGWYGGFRPQRLREGEFLAEQIQLAKAGVSPITGFQYTGSGLEALFTQDMLNRGVAGPFANRPGAGPLAAKGAGGGATQQDTLTPAEGRRLYQRTALSGEQMMSVAIALTQDPEFRGLPPDVVGAAAVRAMSAGATFENLKEIVEANVRGVQTEGLAQQLLLASKQKVSGPEAYALEERIAAEVEGIYEQAELKAGAGMMERLPRSTLERYYGKSFDELAVAETMAEWTRSSYRQLVEQEGALDTSSAMLGVGRAPASTGLMERIREGTATRQEIQELSFRQLREQRAQNIAQQIGYYEPGATAGVYGAVMAGTPQQEQFYQIAAQLAPQAAQLGIGQYTFLGQVAGRGLQGNLLSQQALGLTQKYALWGGQDTQQFFTWSGASLENQVFTQRLMSFDPLAFADAAAQGMPGAAQFAQTVDVGLGGQLTGQSWGTTSLASVGVSAASNAQAIFGNQGIGSGWRNAAVQGYTTPFGKTWGGTRGLGWYMRGLQWEAQQASMGAAMAQIALQEEYMPKFWNIQDQQRALQHEQSLWGFEMQQRQFAMQGTQFQENMGLQRRQSLMQRGWAMEDWAYQDQMRTMQWGWKQEDFAESVRFMTGRQRRLAERQMERETIMYGMEGERIDTQRDRQKEMWSLEDQRFELSKKHFQEQRQLQEENMKKQREFYDEGKKLQDEMIKLQREYQMKQLELQKASIGAQAEAAKKMKEAQDAMQAIADEAADRAGEFNLAKSRQVDMINTIVKGMNHLITNIPGVFQAMGKALIPLFKSGGGSGGGGGSAEFMATGGPTMPNELTFVGEAGIEAIRSSVPQHVFPSNETFASMLGGNDKLTNPWEEAIISNIKDSTGGTQQPTTIIVNIGNERLGEFVLNTVNDALEVR